MGYVLATGRETSFVDVSRNPKRLARCAQLGDGCENLKSKKIVYFANVEEA